jgi:hypothetical protein
LQKERRSRSWFKINSTIIRAIKLSIGPAVQSLAVSCMQGNTVLLIGIVHHMMA